MVHDLDLHVSSGEVVTLLGHNGSGKTTTIKTVLGLFPALGGRVFYDGHDVTRAGFRANVKAGMALIPSERFVFPDLTVIENLLLGGAAREGRRATPRTARAGVRPVPDLEGAQHAGRGDDVRRAAAHVEPGPAR